MEPRAAGQDTGHDANHMDFVWLQSSTWSLHTVWFAVRDEVRDVFRSIPEAMLGARSVE